jgi:predicted DNA-binding protein (MmcQ/YjbR family)
METANALAFRIEAPGVKLRTRIEEDPRIRSAEMKKAQWFSFELSSDSDLHNALDWLSQAYESVTKK